jgi:glucose/mannose transport system permease protein
MSIGRYAIYACLMIFAVLYLMPLYVMITTSLKDIEEIRQGNLLSLPAAPTLVRMGERLGEVLAQAVSVRVSLRSSSTVIRIVVPAVLISTLIGALNGYVLAKWRFRGSEFLFAALLFGCFIPFQVILLPMARLLATFGLANTVTGLVLVHVIYGVAFTTLFFRNFYVSVPTELVKAAQLDGANFFQIFRHIFLPISLPIFTVTIIWQFTQIWNDFLFGVVYSGQGTQPITCRVE